MNYSRPSLRPASTATGKTSTGAENSARETAQPARNTPGSDGLLAFASSYSTTADRRLVSNAVTSADKRVDERTRQASRERVRLFIAGTITILYMAFAGLMLSASTGPQSNGITATFQGGQWVVSWVVPSGLAYDKGVRPGATIRSDAGLPAGNPGDEADLTQFPRLAVSQGDKQISVEISPQDNNNQYSRWGYAILGFIFIFVGGPVFVKAKQRTAATAFYTFCIATAAALAVAMATYLFYGWALALQFVSMVFVAGSFAYFFFQFPVPIAKTRQRAILLLSVLVGGGAVVILGYVWVLVTSPTNYAIIQPVYYLYLAGCAAGGLTRLVTSFTGERSVDVRRQRILLMTGTVLAVAPNLLLGLIPSIITGKPIVSIYTTAFTMAFIPLFFAYAITQHQLLGISGFVRRSVVYLIMGFTVLSAFFIMAAAASAVLPKSWAREEGSVLGFGFFVFLIAVSFGYVQRRVEWAVDRFIYHDAYDYKQALMQFSTQLAAEQDLNVLSHELIERTCRMMNLDCGMLMLAVHPGEVSAMVAHGAPGIGQTDSTIYGESSDAHQLATLLTGPIHTPSRWVTRGKETLPHVHERAGNPYLLAYAHYGDCADWLPQSIEVELSRQGMDLRHTGAPKEFFTFHAGPLYRTSPFSTNHLGKYGIDAEDNHRHKMTGTRHADPDGPRQFLGVPLWTRQRFVGILCLGTKKTGERYGKDDLSLLNTLGGQAALAIYNAQLYEMREQALLDTITALAHAIEAKDTYTLNHCEKITGRAVALAQSLALPQQDVENIRLGSILHDVGKIGIPDAILNKPARLTDEEYELIKEHAVIGARIVQSVGALQGVVPIIRHHQERFDGTGYPDGLSGQGIPIGARIIAVVDAYGAMTEDRVYRKAPGHEVAISELKRFAGRQFDPVIAEAFIHLLETQPEFAEE